LYIHLVAKDTIDERVMESLEEKKDIAQIVVDRVNRRKNDSETIL
jgi:SNF2 family DNA or RNA helicase